MKRKTGNNRFIFYILIVAMLFTLPFFSVHHGQAATMESCPSFPDLISRGAWGVGDGSGELITGCNPDKPLIPASIVKIATALAAMEVLGGDYRFKTHFFLDFENNLYIRSYGDPFLISEEVSLISSRLSELGLKTVNNIFIDDSAFALEYQPPGRENSDNPYDAPVGATSVNFNTVSMRISKGGQASSDARQTPDLPIMSILAHDYRSGNHLINICPRGCQEEEKIARLSGELFAAIMRKEGISVYGHHDRMIVPHSARLLYIHENTKSMEEALRAMLKYSNNFIANLVYLVVGAERFGYPATWSKADLAVREVLSSKLGDEITASIVINEGAGLSRYNRVTVRETLELLSAFKPYAHLLRKRNNTFLKSGTKRGIYNYAGYLGNGKPFVILLGQQNNTRRAILQRLEAMVK